MSSSRLLGAILGVGLLTAGLIGLPSVLGPFNQILATQIMIYCLVAVSLQLLWGRAGQLSFGQAAFFGIGAFSYAIVAMRVQEGWLAIGAAVVIPLVVALLLGYFLFFGGVRGASFSVVTLAFVLIAEQVAISWRSVTGGDSGLTEVPRLELPFMGLTLDFTTRTGRYALAAIVLVVGLVVAVIVKFSRFGLVLESIREDENRAKFLGYNTSGYLTAVLALSAALSGLAGGAFAAVSTFAAPDLMGSVFSIEILTWVAVGGRNYLVGALLGTIILRILNDQISESLPTSWPLVVGLFFIAVVLFFPIGIAGGVSRLGSLLVRPSAGRERE